MLCDPEPHPVVSYTLRIMKSRIHTAMVRETTSHEV